MFPKGGIRDIMEGAPPVSVIVLLSGEINPILTIPSKWEVFPAFGPDFHSVP
jgi:hypothetical protein